MTRGISSSRLSLPKEKRTVDFASSRLAPSARIDGDGLSVPEEHAEPTETAIPPRSSAIKRASPENPGNATAEVQGVPGYRYAVVPHPIGRLPEAELLERVRMAIPEVVSILVGG